MKLIKIGIVTVFVFVLLLLFCTSCKKTIVTEGNQRAAEISVEIIRQLPATAKVLKVIDKYWCYFELNNNVYLFHSQLLSYGFETTITHVCTKQEYTIVVRN